MAIPQELIAEQALLEQIKVAALDDDGSLYLFDKEGKELPYPKSWPKPETIKRFDVFCHYRKIELRKT